jgi:hypothetical protein
VRHGPPPLTGRPDPDLVHEVHDRYLLEIVEGLGLCPFARRSRELGRVHRPVFWAGDGKPSAAEVAGSLAKIAHEHDDAEIVLMTFVGADPRINEPRRLDAFVETIRHAYGSTGAPLFFMVGFHRHHVPEAGRPTTADSLVALLRRTPDPVIQCVRASLLENVRAQAQRAAHERMLTELTALDPAMAAIARHSVQADSELSADIARHNFAAVGHGEGRERLERRILDILAARDAAYGEPAEG